MKKIFGKYDLIKVSGILVLLATFLTWLIPYGYFSGSEMVVEDITRVGLVNFMQYGLLGMYYFTVLITFLFVLGGFYEVLSKAAGYQKLVNGISRKLANHKVIVVIAVSLIFALLTSVSNEYFPLFVLIPFVITVLSKMKVDKISAFVATFGGMLVGTIGSTYSAKVVGYINSTLGTETTTYLGIKILLFVLAFVLLSVFTVLRMNKIKKNAKFEEYDKFEVTTKGKEEVKSWPYAIIFGILFLVTVLAYFPWSTFEITLFTDITTWVNELALFDAPIISYFFGDFTEFGKWDIFTIQFVMLATTVLIHFVSKISWDEIFEAYGVGFKKMGYVVVVLLMVYFILELTVMFPVIPVLVDYICSLADEFNILGAMLTFVASLVASIFGVEMQYVVSLAGNYLATTYASATNVIAIIIQSAFGLVSFIVPSSAILMVGLAYLDIPYKDWFKHIWKFLLAMLVAIIIIIIILAL